MATTRTSSSNITCSESKLESRYPQAAIKGLESEYQSGQDMDAVPTPVSECSPP